MCFKLNGDDHVHELYKASSMLLVDGAEGANMYNSESQW